MVRKSSPASPHPDLTYPFRAILHDEKTYPEPAKYNPDRFLRPDGSLDPNVRDPSVAAFGFGRRICPGRFMAVDSIWITIASVLSVFEIRKAVGEDGKEITPDGEYHRGFLWYVAPRGHSVRLADRRPCATPAIPSHSRASSSRDLRSTKHCFKNWRKGTRRLLLEV